LLLSARHAAGNDGHGLLFLTPDKAKGCGSPKATAAPWWLTVWAWSSRKTGDHPAGRSPRACFSGSCS